MATDVLPGSDVNPVKVTRKGVVPVALLSSPDHDATQVNAAGLRLGTAAPDRRPAVEDVDGDGRADLVLHFRTQDTGLRLGDTQVCLTGQLSDELDFATCEPVRTQ